MSQEYCYIQGRRIDITRREGLIAVVFDSRVPPDEIETYRESTFADLAPTKEFAQMQQSNVRLYSVPPDPQVDTRELIRDLRARSKRHKVGEVYTTENGQPLILTDEIVCKFRPEMTRAKIDQIAEEYALEIVQALAFSENAFVLRVKPEAKQSALHTANELAEAESLVMYCYPNMIEYLGERQTSTVEAAERTQARSGLHPTDPLLHQQWHHDNVGQTVEGVAGVPGADIHTPLAWQTTMGSPDIRIAVIDSGIDITHADLCTPGKCVAPIDLTVCPPDADPLGLRHGTEVAGMAVASANNGCAGAGSAPDCKLIAIKVDDIVAQVRMAHGFVYAADHGADIITCSLGPSDAWILTDLLQEAIDYATTYGRGGRGTPCFQAVSNNNLDYIYVDQVSSYERTIAVSRTNNGDLYDGAGMGLALDLCAPGRDVLTITNTTSQNACPARVVTGTSYATPLAAGVAGLVLSLNRDLSWEEVRQVLLDSADKIGAVPYNTAPPGRPPGRWNDRYGYGRVNAPQALQLASSGSIRDLYLRDAAWDTGTVPQPGWGFWDSPDIWVRNVDDGLTIHQNVVRGQDNYVYARIHNRGCEASLPCWVRFYITTFAGTEFRYPYDYKLDTTNGPAGGTPGNRMPRSEFPAEGTYLVGVERIESVPAGGSVISKVCWSQDLIPPAANWHPCLLVEISPHDGPAPVGVHTWQNNNLAQKNISIVDAVPGQMVTLPFRFSHPLVSESFLTIHVHKTHIPYGCELFLDFQDAGLLQSIAYAGGIDLPTTPVTPAMLDWSSNQPISAIASLEGEQVFALNPHLPTTRLQVPLDGPGRRPALLRVRVPADATAGQSRILNVTQRNAQGLLIGGVRFQMNIVG